MILLIDNYDSFTWNLVHLLGMAGAEIVVRRNDALSVDEALGMGAVGLVISPGPCDPARAGICVPLIRAAADAGQRGPPRGGPGGVADRAGCPYFTVIRPSVAALKPGPCAISQSASTSARSGP